MSSALRGPCHIIRWTSKFARNLAESRLGVEVYAFSDMFFRMSMIREIYGHFSDLTTGMEDLGVCGSLVTHINKKIPAEKFPPRHFLAR